MSEQILSKIRLKDSKESINFRPLKVNSTVNSLLKPIIDAFENSDKVHLGYTTMDKSKGMIKPTMKRKSIYLTGGALRDHLKGKTYKNFDIVTDATPDEIMLILKNSETPIKKVSGHGQFDQKEFVFYPSRFDQKNQPIEITVQKGMQKAHIATMSKNVKNRMISPKEARFTTNIEEDAHTRDITINALYLKLKSSDGDNGELIDPVGGAHDLKTGEIVTVELPETAFKRDIYLPFRIANLACRFSSQKNFPEKFADILKKTHVDAKYDGKILKSYYLASIENQDVSPTQFLKNLKQTNLLQKIFPNCHIAEIMNDLPNNKILTTAYLLHNNDVEMVKNLLLAQGYPKGDVDEIGNFMKLGQWSSGRTHETSLIHDLITKPSRLPHSKILDFLNLFGKGDLYKKVFKQDYSDVTKKFVGGSMGETRPNPSYTKLLGRVPDYDEINNTKKMLLDKAVKEKMNGS